MKRSALFIKKNMFWVCVGLIIVGIYAYGFYVRSNTAKALKYTTRTFVKSLGIPPNAIPDNVWGEIDACFDKMVKSASVEDMKDSEMWALMTVPERLKIYIAWGTKKTMPIMIAVIVLMALVLRTRFSATIDIYSAAREAEINKYRQLSNPTVEVIDTKEQVAQIMSEPAIEVKSQIASTTDMNTF